MKKRTLHQVTTGAAAGDAITDQALLLQGWLREMGFESRLFAEHIDPSLEGKVQPLIQYRPGADERFVVYHHSIGSAAVPMLLTQPVQIALVYHNVTPPDFVAQADVALAGQLQLGRKQLAALRHRTILALADSPYNESELCAAGFPHTGVLPIAIDPSHYEVAPNPELVERLRGGPLLLFVGRLVPNKKQEDLTELLYWYRRVRPKARLALVGADWVPGYAQWLRGVAADLGLQDAVMFAGHVSQRDLVTYYRMASVYVSMSEHEGFGKPLIESMYLGLPVLAYAAAGVPGTLGGAGVLFHRKDCEALAELVDLVITEKSLRERLIAGQRRRAAAFLAPGIRKTWEEHLAFLYGEGQG